MVITEAKIIIQKAKVEKEKKYGSGKIYVDYQMLKFFLRNTFLIKCIIHEV